MNITCPNPNCAALTLTIRDGKFRRKEDGKTVERKLIVIAAVSRQKIKRSEKLWLTHAKRIQLDDLITKEQSKLKPLTVTIAIDETSRRILAVEVSQIPAFGRLARIAIKKYGSRPDQHNQGLERVFHKLSASITEEASFKTDEHPRYPSFIKTYFPKAKHLTYKSERASVAGQGELKKLCYDPLFAVNHTCAMLRANVNRLIRKTWCTTKDPKRLKDHLDIFVYFYNQILLKKGSTPI